MKLVASVLFAVLVLFALYCEINAANPPDAGNCQGSYDLRCPQFGCGPNGARAAIPQDNSKPFPECCGRVLCN